MERVQEIIKIMKINGHDSEDSENTALIKASANGKNSCSFQCTIHLILIMIECNTVFHPFLGFVELVNLLIEHGADVNIPNSIGWTALHSAGGIFNFY